MFGKVNVPVLGIVENMSGFLTPSGERYEIFGKGGGEELSKKYNIPLLGSIPIDVAIREGGDAGDPIAMVHDSESGECFHQLSKAVLAQLKEKAAPASLKVVN